MYFKENIWASVQGQISKLVGGQPNFQGPQQTTRINPKQPKSTLIDYNIIVN